MIDYEQVLLDIVTPMVDDKSSISVKKMDSLDEREFYCMYMQTVKMLLD